MKYLYNFGYYSYEESEYVQLEHELEFSEEQFRSLVHAATKRVLDKIQLGEIDVPVRYSLQDLLNYIVEELEDIYDFKKVKYTAEWECFGWPSILDENSWSGSRDDNLQRLTKYLNSCKYYPDSVKKYEVAGSC